MVCFSMRVETATPCEIRLRHVPPDLRLFFEQKAEDNGQKLTGYVLKILTDIYHQEQQKKRHAFLDELKELKATHSKNGLMTSEEARQLIRESRDETA